MIVKTIRFEWAVLDRNNKVIGYVYTIGKDKNAAAILAGENNRVKAWDVVDSDMVKDHPEFRPKHYVRA